MKKRFSIATSQGSFEMVTQSQRRFIVVDIVGRYTVKRTDSSSTAELERRKDPTRRVVYDTRDEVFR